ncbi:MAG: putative phage abortive infection protein [Saprospiraceae bacterium]|nr:hypothetical protein [Saprospiraceae bacterium]MCB0543279.1 hypothetical protein [Saprospiraceae bacterium]MCB9354684.1 hypothetical protein [Lewinellaceae bacterium]
MQSKDLKHELKERVAKGLNFGIDAVEEVIDRNSDLFNEFVLLKSKYNDLMYMSSLNTLAYEQIELGLDRLRNNLLGIIDRLEEESLSKQQVETDLKIQALPTRRTNFFKLLDIHFQNLEAIAYIEIYNDGEKKETGRKAVFNYYQGHKRRLNTQVSAATDGAIDFVKEYFSSFFGNDGGDWEIYFKNIGHMVAYVMESDVEAQFFMNTLRSLFSRYEQATIYYYALSGVNPEFSALVGKSKLIDPGIRSILLSEAHYGHLT